MSEIKVLSVNGLRILTVLITAILIAATVKAFDGMEKTAAEYSAPDKIVSQDNR